MIYRCHMVVCVLDLHFTLEWPWLGRNGYSIYWCCIHQTCTNCSSWHDLLMQRGGLCPWPIFHTWVTMVRKKWLSLYYNAYESYIHQTCANCLAWHDLLMPCGGLCPWPTFHASVTKTQNGNSRAPVMVPITIISSFLVPYRLAGGTLSLLAVCPSVCLSVSLSVCQSVSPSHFGFPDFPLPSFEILTWNLVCDFVMT